jgi:hypothetical protein
VLTAASTKTLVRCLRDKGVRLRVWPRQCVITRYLLGQPGLHILLIKWPRRKHSHWMGINADQKLLIDCAKKAPIALTLANLKANDIKPKHILKVYTLVHAHNKL